VQLHLITDSKTPFRSIQCRTGRAGRSVARATLVGVRRNSARGEQVKQTEHLLRRCREGGIAFRYR
jgi:hypothetical protein